MLEYIQWYIKWYLKYVIKIETPWLILAGMVFLLFAAIATILKKNNKILIKQAITLPIFVTYILLIFESTVFCRPFTKIRTIRLTPFWTYKSIFILHETGHIPQLIVNIAMFIVIGFLLSVLLKKVNINKVVGISFCITFTIEFLQYILMRGLAEFDDVFHNVLGSILGYLAYCLVLKLSERMKRNNKDKEETV